MTTPNPNGKRAGEPGTRKESSMTEATQATYEVQMIPLGDIAENPMNTRKTFADMEELTDDIARTLRSEQNGEPAAICAGWASRRLRLLSEGTGEKGTA